ncbi:MAG: SDR family NAD(P)-dependent oxidoreductase [Paracoccaceae bacterium]|nr:SDR family NAD(P)-dependent oxidoreductase [Paracoccaceae bacterium]
MKRALVIGATGGIGAALAGELDRRGWAVTALSRSSDGFDVTDESAVEAGLARLAPGFELIVVATGALVIDGAEPEKTICAVTPKALADQFAFNAIGPFLVLKHALHLLPKDRPSTFAALSARVGSIGDNRLGGWASYRTAKAALNQLLHTAAIELARSHKQATVLALHPGTVATDFTAKYAGRHKTVPPETAAKNLADVLETAGPAQSGGFFDYAFKEIPW